MSHSASLTESSHEGRGAFFMYQVNVVLLIFSVDPEQKRTENVDALMLFLFVEYKQDGHGLLIIQGGVL